VERGEMRGESREWGVEEEPLTNGFNGWLWRLGERGVARGKRDNKTQQNKL